MAQNAVLEPEARDTENDSSEPGESCVASVAFWLCLVLTAAVYSLVTLSPRLLTYVTLNHQHHENQLKLVTLEKQVARLTRVIDALEHDPLFAQELVRADFDAGRPDEQRIPVDSQLSLAGPFDAPDLTIAAPALPWYTPMIASVASNPKMSTGLLIMDAALLLFAFGFLRPTVRS